MVKDLNAANTQLAAYNQAITLKDLALTDANKRALMWQDSALSLDTKLSAINTVERHNEILYFALGILVTGAAVYGAGALARH
jgi:hypothetical protein